MIGVAITVHNRNEMAKETISEWKKFMPENSKLVVVDDCSSVPFEGSDYRFSYNVGIARAKNKCLELLDDCDHIFLADDDVFPIVEDWYKPYLESNEPHLSMTFEHLKDGRSNGNKRNRNLPNGLSEYHKPCGCLLYIHKSVVEKIGGFDEGFVRWGFEHVEYSLRAYNHGLTSHPFLDVADSLKLFRSLDHEQSIMSSAGDRKIYIPLNRNRIDNHRKTKRYIHFKRSENKGPENVVLCAYFNYLPDPQRNKVWGPDDQGLKKLAKSVVDEGINIVIFHNGIEEPENTHPLVKWVKVEPNMRMAPNVYRYVVFNEYLKSNPSEKVWLADSTDTEMLRSPFNEMQPDRLYVGCEHDSLVANQWMRKNQDPHMYTIPDYRNIVYSHSKHMLLNCGLTGGYLGIVMKYLSLRVALHENYHDGLLKSTDMAGFNYIMFKFFMNKFEYGDKVNTRFKHYEKNEKSWWRHK
jgi:glycosyltransferase involved in cell wall biosynthesis